MPMVLNGDTGITQPSAAAPAFSAYLSSSTQSLSSGTYTKVTLNAEVFDTNNNFDSSTNYRFTPTVAGYYQINYRIFAGSGNNTAVAASIYKNGTSYVEERNYATGAYLDDWGVSSSALIYLNGSTDYVELWALCVGSAILNGGTAPYYTHMSGFLARSA